MKHALVPLGLLTGLHLLHDMSIGFLGILLPALQENLGLSLAMAGFLLPVSQAGSLLQPYFGHLADRYGALNLVVAGLIGTSVMMGLIGIVPSYGLLLAVLFCVGLSSALYHPAGGILAGAYGRQFRTTALAMYHFGGNVGMALGPIAAGAVLAAWGLGAIPWLAVPGVLFALFCFFALRGSVGQELPRRQGAGGFPWAYFGKHRRVLLPLSMVILGRAIGTGTLMLFLPTLLLERGLGFGMVTAMTGAYFLVGGLGGLASGLLADRFGARQVLAVMLAIVPLSFYGFLLAPIEIGFLLLLLGAAAALGEQPVLISLVQGWSKDMAGSIVGLVMGLQFLLSGAATAVVGLIADQVGLHAAFLIIGVFPLIGLPYALRLPSGDLTDQEGEAART